MANGQKRPHAEPVPECSLMFNWQWSLVICARRCRLRLRNGPKKAEKGTRFNLCEAGHRPKVGRGPLGQIKPGPFFGPFRPVSYSSVSMPCR